MRSALAIVRLSSLPGERGRSIARAYLSFHAWFAARFCTAARGVWVAAALFQAMFALLLAFPAQARESAPPLREIEVAALPPEARDVLERVKVGGPFRYERDGVTFGNRERLLPPHNRGFYHEYTVDTPGARNRGARRIICGGPRKSPEVCYYTDDHYASFRRIRE